MQLSAAPRQNRTICIENGDFFQHKYIFSCSLLVSNILAFTVTLGRVSVGIISTGGGESDRRDVFEELEGRSGQL